jgi:hypothetical protein
MSTSPREVSHRAWHCRACQRGRVACDVNLASGSIAQGPVAELARRMLLGLEPAHPFSSQSSAPRARVPVAAVVLPLAMLAPLPRTTARRRLAQRARQGPGGGCAATGPVGVAASHDHTTPTAAPGRPTRRAAPPAAPAPAPAAAAAGPFAVLLHRSRDTYAHPRRCMLRCCCDRPTSADVGCCGARCGTAIGLRVARKEPKWCAWWSPRRTPPPRAKRKRAERGGTFLAAERPWRAYGRPETRRAVAC